MTGNKKRQPPNSIFMDRLAERGLTQQKLADFVGVSRQRISDWTRGVSTPNLTLGQVSRLCVALNCSSIFELQQIFEPDAPTLPELVREFENL